MPDVIIHDLERDWLFLIDVSARQRHMTEARRTELDKHFASSGRHLVFFSTFPDHRSFCRCVESIAWESHVWLASAPDHMIHFNGERFLGPYQR
jgi:adenine-specific DNA-methyltransferase